jgi:hypothetical protein
VLRGQRLMSLLSQPPLGSQRQKLSELFHWLEVRLASEPEAPARFWRRRHLTALSPIAPSRIYFSVTSGTLKSSHLFASVVHAS